VGIYSRDMEFADVVGGEHVSVLGLISSMLLNRAMLLRQHLNDLCCNMQLEI
jgi:hypothetical protein